MGLEAQNLPMHSLLRGINQTTNIGTLPKGAINILPNQPDVNFLQPHTLFPYHQSQRTNTGHSQALLFFLRGKNTKYT